MSFESGDGDASSHQPPVVVDVMTTIRDLMAQGTAPYEVLQLPHHSAADDELRALNIQRTSPLGAICSSTSGVLFHHGFVRLLAAGRHPKMHRSVSSWTAEKFRSGTADEKGSLIVADDVLGGAFALNAGEIPDTAVGSVAYFCPEGLRWDNLGVDFMEFLSWCTSHDAFCGFYETVLWIGWEKDVRGISGDEAFRFEPALYSGASGGPRKREAVPVADLYAELHQVSSHIKGSIILPA